MAQTGKKINELTQISTVTNETVLPGVYVESGVANSTASKITVQQLSAKVRNDMSDTLAGKQDALVSGSNIKTINNESILGDGNLTVESLPSQEGQSGKFLTTDGSSASWAIVQAAPTLTWYTGNTSTTVTIADTSSANLVKIYKNGILLQPTEDYSISGTTLTLVTALVATDKITTEIF